MFRNVYEKLLKIFKRNGEKIIEEMTVDKVCCITGVPLPKGIDGKRKAGMVYAHPAQMEKGSIIFCSNKLEWKWHCRVYKKHLRPFGNTTT